MRAPLRGAPVRTRGPAPLLAALALLAAVLLAGTTLVPDVEASATGTLRAGSITLVRCATRPALFCGRVLVPLDWSRPRASPSIAVHFQFQPVSDGHAQGTVVAVEGGPGYPSTGSLPDYRAMYGSLLRSHNLLLVDNRGTGQSTPIDCPALQKMPLDASAASYAAVAWACGRALNERWRYRTGAWVHASDLFGTVAAADDLAHIIGALALGPVSIYGDSYGGYFAEVFAEQHPSLVANVVLDSAYPVRGLDPWYRPTIASMPPAFDTVCAQSAACSVQTRSAWGDIKRLVARLDRQPAVATVPNQNGVRQRVTVTATGVVNLVNDAADDPQIYQALDAAARAVVENADAQPLARLYAQRLAEDENYAAEPANQYSSGLYLAVACTDYPQLFSMRSSVPARARQLRAAERALPRGTFSPFTVSQWIAQDPNTEAYTACLDWPAPAAGAQPARTAAGRRLAPGVPVLILSGQLDLWTPASGDAAVARQIGGHVQILRFADSTHVLADDSSACGDLAVQRFIARPRQRLRIACAEQAAIHAVGMFPQRLSQQQPLRPGRTATGSASRTTGTRSDRELAAAAVDTAGDALDRYAAIQCPIDRGLHGGTVSANWSGSVLRLHGDQLVPGVAVSGNIQVVDPPGGTGSTQVTARVSASSPGLPTGHFTARWLGTAPNAHALVSGRVGAALVSGTMPAP